MLASSGAFNMMAVNAFFTNTRARRAINILRASAHAAPAQLPSSPKPASPEGTKSLAKNVSARRANNETDSGRIGATLWHNILIEIWFQHHLMVVYQFAPRIYVFACRAKPLDRTAVWLFYHFWFPFAGTLLFIRSVQCGNYTENMT